MPAADKKILLLCPRFPYPESGACEQDRADGIRQLVRLGYTVNVVGKVFPWQDTRVINTTWSALGVEINNVPYRAKSKRFSLSLFLEKFFYILRNFRYADGAAYEYADPAFKRLVAQKLRDFKPDIVWADYTYLWPLNTLIKASGAKLVVRSINFEPKHFLEEEGRSLLAYIKFLPKLAGEIKSAREADVLLSMNPQEQSKYIKCGAPRVVNLPLRSLGRDWPMHMPREREVLNVFFFGSTYTVSHNARALRFILQELVPAMERQAPGKFFFHIFGGKFPDEFKPLLKPGVVVHGFVDELETLLADQDIALAPSFFGAGMQQKVFEPLVRGFPTITSPRGLAGYPFVPGTEVLLARNLSEYIAALLQLQDLRLRRNLGYNARAKSTALFSGALSDTIVKQELARLC